MTTQGLASLLAALRAAGLPLGVRETLRLRQVLALEPAIDAAGLKRVLRAVAVRSQDEQAILDRVLSAWLDEAERLLPDPASVGLPPGAGTARATRSRWEPLRAGWRRIARAVRRPRRWIWPVLAALVLALAAVAVWWTARGGPAGSGDPSLAPPVATAATTLEPLTSGPAASVSGAPSAGAAPGVSGMAPPPEPPRGKPTPTPAEEPTPSAWTFLFVVLGFAVLTALGLALTVGRRRWLAPPEKRRSAPAEDAPSPPPLPLHAPVLLDARARDDMVWGLGRFAGDRPTRRLDVAATVRATARRGGTPALRFRAGTELRVPWLWMDSACRDRHLHGYARETVRALTEAGIEVGVSVFRGIPAPTDLYQGAPSEEDLYAAPFTPVPLAEVEERRDTCVVVILTDGRLLAARQGSPATDRTLRALRRFPHLAFVDFGDGRHGLRRQVAEHELTVLSPEEMPGFLAEGLAVEGDAASRRIQSTDALRVWAAACALAPEPPTEAQALALRDALGLPLTAWAIRAVAKLGSLGATGLTFPRKTRADLLNWLTGSQADGFALNGPLGRARTYWLGEAVRSSTPWGREVAPLLLGLWGTAGEASRAAEGLYQASEEHAGAIREALRGLSPQLDAGQRLPADNDRAVLPWHLTELDPLARLQLEAMGLEGAGGRQARTSLTTSGRYLLALAWVAGVAVAAVLAMLRWKGLEPNRPADNDFPGALADAGTGAASAADASTADAGSDGGDAEAPDAGEPPITDPSECRYQEKHVELGDSRVRMTFVRVCGGTFRMGSDDADAASDEKPPHRVTVGSFWIGKSEVSNEQYRTRIPQHGTTEDERWPATRVTWEEARAFCQALKSDLRGDLPTEAEWEYAARGPKGRKYPWGEEAPDARRAQFKESSPIEVTAFSDVPSPFGTIQQAGNVWEWIEDCYSSSAYSGSGRDGIKNPVVASPVGCVRVLRGGSFILLDPRLLRSAFRHWYQPELRFEDIGFRCVLGSRREP